MQLVEQALAPWSASIRYADWDDRPEGGRDRLHDRATLERLQVVKSRVDPTECSAAATRLRAREDLERECLEGYAEGLQQAGRTGREEVLLGYLLSSVLRIGVGAVPPLLGLTMTNEHEDLVVKVFGCSYEEFVANTAAVLRFQQQRRIHRAKALLGI